MTMRDKIAEILDEADMNYSITGEGPSSTAMADAILAAMPDMIAPLVWVEDNDVYYNDEFGYNFTLIDTVIDGGFSICVGDTQVGDDLFGVPEEAQAAANTHHRAAFKAILTGETEK